MENNNYFFLTNLREKIEEGDINSIERLIERRKEYNVKDLDIVYNIVRTYDINFIKMFMHKKEKYNWTSELFANALEFVPSDDFKKEIIKRRGDFDFSPDDLVCIILSIRDKDFIKQCIENAESYGMHEKEIEKLLKGTKDVSYIVDYVQKNSGKKRESQKKIKLPEKMTIGIEIESEGELSGRIWALGFENEWEQTFDESLIDGVEVKSPILNSGENRECEIYDVCSILRLCGNKATERCGGHIHIGADYLKNIEAWKNLIEIWANTENILYIIGNEAGIPPRKGIYRWARPIFPRIEKLMEEGEIDLQNDEDLESLCFDLVEYVQDYLRYSGINFINVGAEEKNTIEFRLPNGTISGDTWIENINLFGGLVATSQELADIQEKIKRGISITEKESQKIETFNRIVEVKNTQENEVEKLKDLLKLVIDEEDWGIYLSRYQINSQLISKRIVQGENPILVRKDRIKQSVPKKEDDGR